MKKTLCLIFSIIFVLLISFKMPSQAEHFSGGFVSGNLTYAVGGGSVTIAQTAAKQWNGITPKASLTYSTVKNQYGYTAKIIAYCNYTNAPTSLVYGQTYPYRSFTGTSASLATVNETWVKAVCYQYINPSLNTSNKKIKTATHELGHALSLDHPYYEHYAIMNQGIWDAYKLYTSDKDALKKKWGK